jgi:hypothetical protein
VNRIRRMLFATLGTRAGLQSRPWSEDRKGLGILKGANTLFGAVGKLVEGNSRIKTRGYRHGSDRLLHAVPYRSNYSRVESRVVARRRCLLAPHLTDRPNAA